MDNIYEILQSIREEVDYKSSVNFIKDGLLDSLDTVTLVTLLEEKFDILIDALDIVPENFESVNTIAKIVRKSGGTI